MRPRAGSSFFRESGILAGLTATAIALASPASATETAASPEPVSIADSLSAEVLRLFKERRDAVVKVRARDGLGLRFGSGFFLDPSGTIYTHAGIVTNADEVTVLHDGRELAAQVLLIDPRSGIALLKVEANSPFIPSGDSDSLEVASPLVTLGFPEDKDVCPSFGMVAGFDRQYLGQFFSTTHIRANLPVQKGQGGAPVLNMRGEAVGILVARIEGGAACHILPIRAAEKVRLDYVRFGALRPGWVGAQVEDSAVPVEGSTAKVEAVDPATPAARAGLESGDIVLRIGSTTVQSSLDVPDASYFLTAGDPTEIEVVRGGERLTLTVKPSLHPLVQDPPPSEPMQAALPDAPALKLE